jgi:predicted RNA-binding Zn-ribbon protein involved in translation (DUF1610 family)
MSESARAQARPGDEATIALLETVGARVATHFVGTGTFHCPKCNTPRCLRVEADAIAYVFACDRCGWHGGGRLPFSAKRHRRAQRLAKGRS